MDQVDHLNKDSVVLSHSRVSTIGDISLNISYGFCSILTGM
ncbi:hypothetical protein J2Z48_001448 [Croceifilum oryzae]|uniref:Uncharacterized protein n=1 Tax=Croceifilum oryzae TaxID=1553429 RepID=A0AAJ1TJI7_9BACL|nr:hypothetical protein [Croceifilum oryzae]